MRRVILLIIISLGGGYASGQTLTDPIYFNVSYLPQSQFKESPGSVMSRWVEFNLTTPGPGLGQKLKIFNAFYYRNSHFWFDNVSSERTLLPQTLHDIRYTAIARVAISQKWELVALPRLAVRSDLNHRLSGNDLFPSLVVLGNYCVPGNPNFKIGLGLALNNDFRRKALIPIGSLVYDHPKFKAEIIYPSAQFLYKQSADFEFGLYVLVDGAISNTSPIPTRPEQTEYLRTLQVVVAPALSYRVYKDFFAHLKVGYTPVRGYQFMNQDFRAIQPGDNNLRATGFLRMGISYRLEQ
jgi:hypothetical protein